MVNKVEIAISFFQPLGISKVRVTTEGDNIRTIYKDEKGVSAVIGTIMALMVILAFMSMILLYWVPAAMEANEDEHMKDVSNQFSQFKETLDDMIRTDYRNRTVDSTFKLGSDGVPPFARETSGQLALQPYEENDPLNNHHFQLIFNDSGEMLIENSSGYLELEAYNRYFVFQRYTYEQGAIVLYQTQGTVVKTGPDLKITKENTGQQDLTLSITLITLLHDTGQSITGTGKETVKAELWYKDEWTYNNITSINRQINLQILSEYATTAWWEYFNDTLPSFNLTYGTDYVYGGQIYNPGSSSEYRSLSIGFNRIKSLTIRHAYFWVAIGKEA